MRERGHIGWEETNACFKFRTSTRHSTPGRDGTATADRIESAHVFPECNLMSAWGTHARSYLFDLAQGHKQDARTEAVNFERDSSRE